VAVHAGQRRIDVMLPATVPVGLLLPDLWDIVADTTPDADEWRPGSAPRLSAPDLPPLDESKTLPENGICDGDILVLAGATKPPRLLRAIDVAETLGRITASATSRWNNEHSWRAALMVAVTLAGTGGFIAVPGPPGIPQLLLTASATGTAAAIAARLTSGYRTALIATALSCAMVIMAALTGILFGVSMYQTGLLLATLATAVLANASRLTLLFSGLSACAAEQLDADAEPDEPEPSVVDLLTALVFSACAAAILGVFMVLARATGPGCALAAAVTATLLLRMRTLRSISHRVALLVAGTVCATGTLLALPPLPTPWLLTAVAAAIVATLWYGRRPCDSALPPLAGRVATAAECIALAAVLPLACWSAGLYATTPPVGLS